MAKCKYILQLPGGESIELPSNFGKLDKEESIDALFLDYKNASDENKAEVLGELRELIKNKVPDNIHGNTINTLIKKSTSIDNLYEALNIIIEKLGTYENIGEAVYNYVKSGASKKGGKNLNLDKLLKGLKVPRNPKYFKNLGLSGIIGKTNLKDEKNRVYANDIENKEFGFSTDISSNLNVFLNSLILKYPDDATSNILYGNSSYIDNAINYEDITLFELDNDLSLFLGLFKKEALKVNETDLISLLENINKIFKDKKQKEINLKDFDINSFFNGEIQDKKIIISKFEEILETAKEIDISKELDSILKLVSNTIKENDYSLSLAIRKLFWALSPDSYGKNNLFVQLNIKKQINEEAKIEQEYKKNRLSFLEMDSTIRDYNYALKEIITDDVYNNSLENITLHKDIVKFPIDRTNKTIYGLVTGIYKRENGVAIYGVYKNQNGELETLNYTFKNSDEIEYRKREDAIDPYIENETIINKEGTLIVSDKEMNQALLKKIIRKGDMVSGNLVLGINPSYITVKTGKGPIKNYYKGIKSVKSAIALEEMKNELLINPNQYIQTNNGNDLIDGDYFLFESNGKKFYKRILFTDNDNVYSWVPGKKVGDPAIIKPTSKKGLVGLKDAYGELTIEEITTIRKKGDRVMSSFIDPKIAKEGDFFSFTENNKKKFGKILKNNKVVIVNNDLSDRIIDSLENIKDVKFFTTRDISSNYAFFNLRVNNREISFDKLSDLDEEVRYMIPKDTVLSKIVMMPNGYANIGTYRTLKEIETNNKNPNLIQEIDITDNILKILDKSFLTPIYVQKKSNSSDKYKLNLDSLLQIKYFSLLDNETKKELDILQPGVYVSLYGKNDIKNIYRIISVEDNIVKLQTNKTSPTGDILTIEIDITKEELLNKDGSVNSIAQLYMQKGNNKMSNVIKETNKLNKSEDREFTNKAINTLIKNMKKYIKDLTINVELVSEKENFESGQKAKIITLEDGSTSILINDQIGKTEDVVHEFLHLFLTPLRYKHPEIYNSFIKSIVKDESLNVTQAEEEFVKYVSSEMIKGNDFINNFEDLNTFVLGLQIILNDVNLEYQIKAEDNPISLLNTSLMKLFDVNINDKMHPMYNLTMITTEPMMREWMDKNNITLNCT